MLPNKMTETYVKLFSALRDALLTKYGNTGNLSTFLTDFESAATNALREVFPSATLKGCLFHLRQTLMQ